MEPEIPDLSKERIIWVGIFGRHAITLPKVKRIIEWPPEIPKGFLWLGLCGTILLGISPRNLNTQARYLGST